MMHPPPPRPHTLLAREHPLHALRPTRCPELRREHSTPNVPNCRLLRDRCSQCITLAAGTASLVEGEGEPKRLGVPGASRGASHLWIAPDPGRIRPSDLRVGI